ncbi:MFS_1_like domain-containing protein [Nephila pilipes]|uniref:MFS_1_like domain-containing protein n=1 Tax=Nephila pilipes TaxID=299642 RepID=A0A8X6T9T4_NEPPI|nr:MFS_1_like domain-containing protein [Nephila pilipes]
MCQAFQIRINKQLLTLKISLCLWLCATSALMTYLTLLLKQRGLSLEEISIIYLAAHVIQFFCGIVCGVIADKVRKPVSLVILSILFSCAGALCLAFSPTIAETVDKPQVFGELFCGRSETLGFGINRTCEIDYPVKLCNETCSNIRDFQCCELSSIDKIFQSEKNGTFTYGFTSYNRFNFSFCLNDSKVIVIANDDYSLCNVYQNLTCKKSCLENRLTSDRNKYLSLYVIIIILFLNVHEGGFRFLDILIMSLIKLHKADYGKQKAWSTIGTLAGPSLCALMIYMTTSSDEQVNYTATLYLYVFLCILTIVTVSMIDAKPDTPTKKMWKASTILLKNVDFLLFTFIVFVLGATWGFRVSFKNVYLEDLGTPTYLIGLIETFANLYGLPVLLTSKWITDKIGNPTIFILALSGYGLMSVGYSFLQEPWPAFLLELFPALSFQLFWVAALNFSVEVSPDELKGTVIAFAGSVHFSAGRALGTIVGGLLMGAYGGSAAFQVIAGVNIVTALFYVIYLYNKYVQRRKS